MLKQSLTSLITIFLMTFTILGYALDPDVIALVHNKTRESLTQVCQDKMKDLTPLACACLGDKAQENLDDAELSGCPNEGSKICVKNAVETATIMALSKDSILSCTSQTGQSMPTPDNAQSVTPLSPNQD